jgi:hypothetical protein
MKKIAISQPRYLPALNYLQRLYFADLFVFLDNVQIQSRGWENRNKLLINNTEKWLTVPLKSSHREIIINTAINGMAWVDKHKRMIYHSYRNHSYYDGALVEAYYHGVEGVMEYSSSNFADTMIHLCKNACKIFDFLPRIRRSSHYGSTNEVHGPEKLLRIAEETNAGIYISGSNGRQYGVVETFEGSGISVIFHDFTYPVYDQYGHESFVPWLGFFDPLFNLGVEQVKSRIYEEPVLNER